MYAPTDPAVDEFELENTEVVADSGSFVLPSGVYKAQMGPRRS